MTVEKTLLWRNLFLPCFLLWISAISPLKGDLEPTFGRCCGYGVNWAREKKQCSTFPAPVAGVTSEHQSICITSASICCLRMYRDEQCQKGKQFAQSGQECLDNDDEGGEFFKDCCDACKLGLVSGSMGMGCNMRFKFGFPWDNSYLQCCSQASPTNALTPDLSEPVQGPGGQGFGFGTLYPGVSLPGISVPESEDLCARFPGKLCAHVCVPTPGSYRCQCRAGFTLSTDGKTCLQDALTDRCQLNNPCAHICRDTGISIECSCNPGYKLALDQRSCEDNDECADGLDNCDRTTHFCLNTQGSFMCQEKGGPNDCIAGYKYSAQQQTCVDVDECAEELHGCDPEEEVCRNIAGAYECDMKCDEGFQFSLALRTCVDRDECVDVPCDLGWECHNTAGSYTCHELPRALCPAGYKPSNSSTTGCEDIDECAEDSFSCEQATQTCINSVGSYRCIDRQPACDFGYRFNEEQRSCVDIDECAEGRDLCNKITEKCVNSPGDYWCSPKPKLTDANGTDSSVSSLPARTTTTASITSTTTTTTTTPAPSTLDRSRITGPQCPPGTSYNAKYRSCRDIDECDNDPCDENELCENTQGSFKCGCRDGFRKDDSADECKDINECQLGLHSCETTQRCDNTIGSYACIRITGCGTGYTLNHNTGECDDNDECELGTHDCDQLGPKYQCYNIKGSFRCGKKACPPAQMLSSDGTCIELSCEPGLKPGDKTCIDINECAEGSPCRRNEQCLNTFGSYRCRALLNCGAGYQMNEQGTQCVDIDECLEGTHQCTGNQVCANRRGGYICQCPVGYRLNNQRQCEDVNECESYFGSICANNAVCENTDGSYRCNCMTGFKQSADSRTCVDIDECTEIPGICHHNCINIWGSHQCTCRAGYNLAVDNRTCTDIDECEEFRGRGRLCIGMCINTAGSFKCSCPDGYRLAVDGRTCKDIDECESGTVCQGSNEQCVNTRGGYKCNAITCPTNYIRDTQHKNRCKKVSLYCREDDEVCRRKPLSYSYNFLPLVSNLTLPGIGQVDLFTMRGPLWSSTTVQFELELVSARAPAGVEAATREFFHLKRTAFNQAVISLVKSIMGPQEVKLSLNMQLYHQGAYGGSAVAELLLYVSEYDF